jgi:hypothetical protein
VRDVTHIVLGAYIEKPTAAEKSAANVGILRNLLDAVEETSQDLQHITGRVRMDASAGARERISRLDAKGGALAMALVKRTVIGLNADKKSAILYRDSPNLTSRASRTSLAAPPCTKPPCTSTTFLIPAFLFSRIDSRPGRVSTSYLGRTLIANVTAGAPPCD